MPRQFLSSIVIAVFTCINIVPVLAQLPWRETPLQLLQPVLSGYDNGSSNYGRPYEPFDALRQEQFGAAFRQDQANPSQLDLNASKEEKQETDSNEESKETKKSDYFSEYDSGFRIRPHDDSKHPFELKVNGRIQFRYHGFARDVPTWTDNAGLTRPIRNRNAWDIERARLVFSGFAQDKRLTYFMQLDGDTDDEHIVEFLDYYWGWEFNDCFQIQFGKRKVSAGRQWILSSSHTRFVDRPMANDFFRPDRTVGLFALGQFGDVCHYELMLGNGYQTASIPDSQSDDQFTFAATNYFDPWGDYGDPIVDYDWTCSPLVRFGHSYVYSPQTSGTLGQPTAEAEFARLSDGTMLTQPRALFPGATVSDYDVTFYGIDFGIKYNGWSMNAEVFLRWIDNIQANAPLPLSNLMQRGFYVEGGRFLIPQRLDLNLRYSQVSGLFGDASEYAIGCNCYPLDTSRMKFSFDVTSLDGSPLQNSSSDINVGDNGLLFRAQLQAAF
jgi:hypothetical protein